jgi:hypothetical protein
MWLVEKVTTGKGKGRRLTHSVRVDPSPEDPLTSPLSEPDRFEALECLVRLHWEGMTRPTILRTLIFLGNLINEYRNAGQQTPDDKNDWQPNMGSLSRKHY